MIRRVIPLLWLTIAAIGFAAHGAAAAEGTPQAKPGPGVYFLDDVMPVVSKMGCNLSHCHGAAKGKKGFKLSMFGADPAQDYEAFTKSAEGRRVNRVEPAKSLILLKATETIPHEGGKKVPPGSPEYRLLASWIAQGARWSDAARPKVASLKVVPEAQVLQKGQTGQLKATAVFSDGREKDVTGLALFAAPQGGAAVVDDAGLVKANTYGESVVVVTYMRKPVPVRITVPQPLKKPFPKFKPNNKIDELVLAKLEKLGIPPSGLCSDEEFLRRVYLDVIGTLPTADEARAFLSDADPNKRAKLVDRLIDCDEFADFWALKWGDLFRTKSEYPSNLWPNAVQAYGHWVRDSIAHNKPYDQFATELITSSGSNFRVPPANFYRAFLKREPQSLAEVTALIFMGARIGCARCHAHPTEDWTLDDDLGLAAIFAPVRYKATTEWKEEIVYVNPRQTMRHPITKEVVPPTLLGGETLEVPAGEDPRVKFAQWLTSPDNPWFARNIVNRIWFWLLGRGIVHEPDDLRSTNPPSNPPLLEYLEKELVASHYDLKHIYRLILNSRTYQLSARSNEFNAWDVANFSHYYVKRLGAETLLDAIGQVTERWDTYTSRIPEPFVRLPAGFRATHLADGSVGLPFLELFGRPPRDTAYESDRDLKLSMRQTLHLLNSTDVQNKIAGSPRLRRLMQQFKDDSKIVEELYLSTLSRFPTEQERGKLLDFMSGKGKAVPEQVEADKNAADEALAKVSAKLAQANTEYQAAEKAARQAEAAAAAKVKAKADDAGNAPAAQTAAENRKAANEAKARRDKLARDEKAASAKAAGAGKKLAAAKAALKPRRDRALQDVLWAVLNTKEFVFNH